MDSKLKALIEDYFNNLMKTQPHIATSMGIHDYDDEMPDGSAEAIERYYDNLKKFKKVLEDFPADELSFESNIDREGLIYTFNVELFLHEKKQLAWRMPSGSEDVGLALYAPFIGTYAPFNERLTSIAARLEKLPRYLEECKSTLKDPVRLYVENGIEECEGNKFFIDEIQKTAWEAGIDPKLLDRVNDACNRAKIELDNYAKWLKEEKLPGAKEEFAMTPEDVDELLRIRELGMNREEMFAYAEKVLESSRAAQREIAAEYAPGKPFEEAKKIIFSKHPETFEKALEMTKEATENSREFVIKSGFATVPEGEVLKVVETPAFGRALTPTGAYLNPGPFDKDQIGHYWMTRPDPEKGQSMSMYYIGSILNTSVHEGYPGHHLQLVCANKNPSKARLLMLADEFCEGWAHYCEEKVGEMGFSLEPEVLFERHNDMIFRALRIIVDIKLSGGEMGYDEAIEFLMKGVGYDKHHCKSEVNRYIISPGYQLSYLIGKKLILELAESVKKEAGENFDLRKFHDTILYAGNMPMKFIAKTVHHAFREPVHK